MHGTILQDAEHGALWCQGFVPFLLMSEHEKVSEVSQVENKNAVHCRA